MNTTMRSRKRSTNISLDAALVDEAKMLNINLSAALNSALEHVVRAERQARWRQENKAAIDAMNQFTAEHSIPRSSTGLRVFKRIREQYSEGRIIRNTRISSSLSPINLSISTPGSLFLLSGGVSHYPG